MIVRTTIVTSGFEILALTTSCFRHSRRVILFYRNPYQRVLTKLRRSRKKMSNRNTRSKNARPKKWNKRVKIRPWSTCGFIFIKSEFAWERRRRSPGTERDLWIFSLVLFFHFPLPTLFWFFLSLYEAPWTWSRRGNFSSPRERQQRDNYFSRVSWLFEP